MQGKLRQQDLFFIRRNTNRNEVHYAITTDGDDHAPVGQHPISGYWQMHEKGLRITEPITVFEQLAFGIASQRIEGGCIFIKLTALPDREIRIERTAHDTNKYVARTMINGAETQLTDFYVFAEAAFLMPKVKYFEIHGLRDGERVTERINK